MNVLGIDPGLKGALALYDGKELALLDMPSVRAKGRGYNVDWDKLNTNWDERFKGTYHVYLEQVHSMPGQGVAAVFKFGMVFGGLHGIIAAKKLPMTLVYPRAWKKHFGLGPSKKDAIILATSMFPDYESQFYGPKGGLKDGVAEAALIAFYGHLQLKG